LGPVKNDFLLVLAPVGANYPIFNFHFSLIATISNRTGACAVNCFGQYFNIRQSFNSATRSGGNSDKYGGLDNFWSE
jgi:hypothetical protein